MTTPAMRSPSRSTADVWHDKRAIEELISRYADGVNRGDWDQVEAAYAPDALWEAPLFGLRFESARAFREFLASSTQTTELLVQTTHCTVVRFADDDTASATTTIHEFTRGTNAFDSPFGRAGDVTNFEDYGIYYDDVARIDGEWRFTHRLFVPLYVDNGRVVGDVLTTRAQLEASAGLTRLG